MQVLFVTLPAYGHAAPLSSIAAELAHRGHRVAWVAHGSLKGRLLPADAEIFAVDGPPDPPSGRGGGAGVRWYFERVLPQAATAMLPTVKSAIETWNPDVLVVEQNCLAGSIAARQAGIPWVSVHVTPILLVEPFRDLPMIQDWMNAQIAQIQRAAGVDPLPWPIRSDRSIIASSRAFLGEHAALQAGDELVGALVDHRGGEVIPTLPDPPRIFVSFGTEAGERGEAFLERVVQAVQPLGSVIATSVWLPVLDLLPHVDVVVCHGGQNTVTEALHFGVPLVIAPVQYDQPAVAARVEALGAGRVVSFERADANTLREAVADVLTDPSYRRRAREIGASLTSGSAAAADVVLGAR